MTSVFALTAAAWTLAGPDWMTGLLLAAVFAVGTVLTAGDGGGAGDAGAGSAPEGSVDVGDSRDAGADPGASAAGDSDGDDDPDGFDPAEYDTDDPNVKNHPAFKRVMNRVKKLSKWRSKHAPIIERVRGVDVDSLSARARAADAFEEQLRRNPKLRRAMVEEDETAPGRDAPDPADEPFDDKSFPFDRSAPGADYMIEQARTVHTLRQQNRRLESRLAALEQSTNGVRQEIQQERHGKVVSEWKSAVDAAAAKVPESQGGVKLRQMFKDAVAGAFRHARENNIKIRPEAVIKHYLGEFGLSKGTQQVAAQAAAQRMAENNRTLPRGQAIAGRGQPTSPQRHKLTVSQVNARLRQQR